MSLREQIADRIISNNLDFKTRLNGIPYHFRLPCIEREYTLGRNRKIVDEKMKQRAEELADEQMKLLMN